jgi:hypothetical protein
MIYHRGFRVKAGLLDCRSVIKIEFGKNGLAVVRHYCGRSQQIDLERIGNEQSSIMPALLLSIFRFVRLLLSGHQAIAIENAALRL